LTLGPGRAIEVTWTSTDGRRTLRGPFTPLGPPE
jgi:hypothetical protein